MSRYMSEAHKLFRDVGAKAAQEPLVSKPLPADLVHTLTGHALVPAGKLRPAVSK